MNQEQVENKITEKTKAILDRMGFLVEVATSRIIDEEKDHIILSVTSQDDSGFLIGKNGNNLEALEHVIRASLNKDQELPRVSFTLDVNDYRKAKTKQLIGTAKEVAERVTQTAKAEALSPMTSYERRLVHLELAAFKSVATESIGQEPKRRIVIKPL